MALVAAAVTYLLVPGVRVFAIRIGAMPEVRDRDVHTTPTPRLGGLAMYGGLVAGLLVARSLPYAGGRLADAEVADGNVVLALILAGGLITLTGFLDDWWGMDAFIKLAGQIGAAGVLVAFGVSLPWLPLPSDMGGAYVLGSTLGPVITIMIVVVMINAVNFVDGLDGLAAGIVGIAAMATWTYSIILSTDNGDTTINVTAAVASVLIGVCLGFLPHNFHPAKIFMGDTGAMLIGLVLASTMITITPLDSSTINDFPVVLPLLIPIAILVLPLLDLIMAVIRRTSNGLSPFAPDRGHLHHRLLDIGHSHRSSVLIMYAWTVLFAFAVVAMSVVGVPLLLFLLTVLLAIGGLALVALPRWRSRRNGGGRGAHAAGRRARPDEGPAEQVARAVPAPPAAQETWTPSASAPVAFPQPLAAPVAPEGVPRFPAAPAVPEASPRSPAAPAAGPVPSPQPPRSPRSPAAPAVPPAAEPGDDTAVLSIVPELPGPSRSATRGPAARFPNP
ncbi:UDP-phosphate alpha-N-acetylglucosaminyl 1-phosphate transferase [Planomonospora sphaerica]|uniref:UDP-phosphate alpha-N-acetylglucosaminyl 1-phosphate transferase n=2 Tax=Planomonospora sphaerica TaxID=161355 RepID=A0A161LIS2_9ACTN|nr:UDP-phosphate alpha-N-acetylglucosaminyl 1-phosphate transferase [Planomonospora sphaerica]